MDLQALLSHLPHADKDDIRNQCIKKIAEKTCPICHEVIKVPVKLIRPTIHCDKCGDESCAFVCLPCTRQWLQLNKPPRDRTPVKHLICNDTIQTVYLNALRSYEIDYQLMDLLDNCCPIVCSCNCGKEFNKRSLFHTHMSDGTCPLSIFKCRFCEFRGNTSQYILHTTRDVENGGCEIIFNMLYER
jgi:hypothetical protein